MYKYLCLNPIAQCGLDQFAGNYGKTEEAAEAGVEAKAETTAKQRPPIS